MLEVAGGAEKAPSMARGIQESEPSSFVRDAGGVQQRAAEHRGPGQSLSWEQEFSERSSACPSHTHRCRARGLPERAPSCPGRPPAPGLDPTRGLVVVGALVLTTPAKSKARELSPSSRPGAQRAHGPELTSLQGTAGGAIAVPGPGAVSRAERM